MSWTEAIADLGKRVVGMQLVVNMSAPGSKARMIERRVQFINLGIMFATRHVHSSRKRGRHTSNLWAARLACALQARGQGPLPYKAKP